MRRADYDVFKMYLAHNKHSINVDPSVHITISLGMPSLMFSSAIMGN